MSKFKSFAQQGSFRDYQLQAPDQTAKIEKETARNIRGRQRAQSFLERNQELYLQAQKLAQGVEENQREQNFKLETENRQAFKDALDRDYKIQTRNDEIRAKQSQELYKSIMPLAKSAGELFNTFQKVQFERDQKINAELAYTAGADYKTVIAIQSLGDNLTKSEFAQTEFMRQQLAKGGNLDALFALYERRASKGFINNIAVAQNTAFSFHDSSLQNSAEFLKANPNATVEEQLLNSRTYEREFAANLKGEDGKSLNADLLNQYVFPTMRRSQTQFNSHFEKLRRKEQEAIVKQDQLKGLNHQWNTGKSAAVMDWLTTDPSQAKFDLFAEWVTNKSTDFSQSGLSAQDIERLRDYQYEGPNFKQTGKRTSYGASRGVLADGTLFNQALNTRKRAEVNAYRLGVQTREQQGEANAIDLYNKVAADGSISQADLDAAVESDLATGIPGFESKATALMRKELDSVRFDAAYTQLFTEKLNKGTLTVEDLDQKGVSFAVKSKFLPEIEKQGLLVNTPEYEDAEEAISNAITEHPRVKAGRKGSNKDHYSTVIFKAEQLQLLKKDVLKGIPIQEAVAGRLGIIAQKQAAEGAINAHGHYTSAVQSQAKGAVNYQEALQEDKAFIEGSLKPNFRKDAAAAVNTYGQDDFYADYYPMQRGEVTPQLKRRAAIMGVSPLVAINFLASGLGQPAVAMDAQMQAIADRITPITGRLINNYRNSGSHGARMNQAYHIMNNTVAVAPVRGEDVNPTPRQVYDFIRALGHSDIHAKGILANIRGEVGLNADGRFPTARMGDGGMSGGLFQMYNDRYRKMESAVPDWRTNWRGQIQHALQDDTAPQYLQMQFPDGVSAADWFLENYERPAMEHRPGRRELNRSFIPQLGF